VIVVTPQVDLDLPTLIAWSQRGITNSQVTLSPLYPGALQEIPVGRGTGSFFAVEGTLDGKPVAGFLGGVFGPQDALRLRLLAVADREQWLDFRDAALMMLLSIRLEDPVASEETVNVPSPITP
jgi:hypothetical protein